LNGTAELPTKLVTRGIPGRLAACEARQRKEHGGARLHLPPGSIASFESSADSIMLFMMAQPLAYVLPFMS
jgi:hypothetical protein